MVGLLDFRSSIPRLNSDWGHCAVSLSIMSTLLSECLSLPRPITQVPANLADGLADGTPVMD